MLQQNDFEALQKQLLDLKGSNYILEEKCKKLNFENSSLKHQNENFDSEIQRLNKILGKTKKIKEIDSLIQENELLQSKLHSQEEDFKLQHKTLMDEISYLMKENEKLLKDLEISSSLKVDNYDSEVIIQLKAENSVLKKALYENESSETKENMPDELKDLKLKIHTYEEEKTLINENHSKKIKDYRTQIDDLNKIIDNMNDSLRKSQETIDQLKIERDDILQSSQKQLDLIKESLNSDINSLKDTIDKMNDENSLLNNKCLKYEEHIQVLESEIGNIASENNKRIREIETNYQQANKKLNELKIEYDKLKQELDESKIGYMNLLQEMQNYETKDLESSKKLDEINKIAERRKQLLDDLSIKAQDQNELHSNEIRLLKNQNEELSTNYEKTLNELNLLKEKYSNQEETIERLELVKIDNQKQINELKCNLEKNKNEFELILHQKETFYESQINEIEQKLIQENDQVEKTFFEEKSLIQQRNIELENQINNLQNDYDKLKQELTDEKDAKKLTEKKHQAAIKDIKRQLQLEKKRGDKLQEKLIEAKLNYDDISYDAESKKSFNGGGSLVGGMQNGDTCSVSSLDNTLRQNSQTIDESKQLLDKIAQLQELNWRLEEKVNHLETANSAMAQDLMNKSSIISYYSLDKKQTYKSTNLPSNTSSISLSLKNFVNEIKNNNKTIFQSSEIDDIKKLQLLLEETLTKNMHLEQDMEKLTKEMQKLKSR